MASGKTTKLYWVTTADHDEDWFIFALSARQARSYHEQYEGYGRGDASSRLVVSKVALEKFQKGTPPCHAQFQDLFQLGFEDAGSKPNLRRLQFNSEVFEEGMLKSIVDTGRKNQGVCGGAGKHAAEASHVGDDETRGGGGEDKAADGELKTGRGAEKKTVGDGQQQTDG